MSDSLLETQVYRMIGMGPSLAVMLAGVVLALRNLQRHPRPCWVLLAALALSAFNNLGMPLIIQAVLQLLGGITPSNNRGIMTLLFTLPYSLVGAVSWALILFAIFDRPDPPKFLVEDDLERDVLDRR